MASTMASEMKYKHTDFPKWIQEPRVIRMEHSAPEDALLAVGLYWNDAVWTEEDDCPQGRRGWRKPSQNDGVPWLIKAYGMGPWFSYRCATKEEIADYDAVILEEMKIAGGDIAPVASGKTLPEFPAWMIDVHIIEHDTAWADREVTAIGMSQRDHALWMIRSRGMGPWVDCRSAGPDEIAKYDRAVLKDWGITGDFKPEIGTGITLATDSGVQCEMDRFGVWIASSDALPGMTGKGLTREGAIKAFLHVARLIKHGFAE